MDFAEVLQDVVDVLFRVLRLFVDLRFQFFEYFTLLFFT
jgi:hypothetical protein